MSVMVSPLRVGTGYGRERDVLLIQHAMMRVILKPYTVAAVVPVDDIAIQLFRGSLVEREHFNILFHESCLSAGSESM